MQCKNPTSRLQEPRSQRIKNFPQLEYDNYRDLTHAPMLMQCFIHVKFNFREKNQIPPFEKFPFLVLARNVIVLPHLSILCSIICQLVAYWRLKTKENFKLLAIKVVVGAYERWLLTRDSNYSYSTCKLLVFWKTGCWGEVVAYARWS